MFIKIHQLSKLIKQIHQNSPFLHQNSLETKSLINRRRHLLGVLRRIAGREAPQGFIRDLAEWCNELLKKTSCSTA